MVATLLLGNWQMNRASQKEELQRRLDRFAREPSVQLPAAPLDPERMRFRRVQVEGEFEPRHLIYLDNKVYRRVAGYQVVTPLRIGDSNMRVLVNRGWVAGTGRRDELPQVVTPSATVRIEGLAMVPSANVLELSPHTVEGRVWENLVLERYRQSVPFPIQPIVIQQTSPAEDGLVRDWPRPDLGIEKHKGYALQWFALCIAIFAAYVALNSKRSATAQ